MKHLVNFGLLLLFVIAGQMVFAQTDKEKAAELGKQAIILEDNGNFAGALKILTEAQKLDPESLTYPYEMGFSYYGLKEYQKAIDCLTPLVNSNKTFARVFQLLGNSYDNLGQTPKAIETYDAGLKLFPNAGELYLESAVIQLGKKDYTKALGYCERGIKADPSFPSNYYWASRIYCASDEKIWGMIYGEIFMNLEPGTKRTAIISKLLFDTYTSNIQITADTSVRETFSKTTVVSAEAFMDPKHPKLPFSMAYEPTLLLAVTNQKTIDLAALNSIRQKFIENYKARGFNKTYPNALFDYHQKLIDEGQFEAYNYWLLMQGDVAAFNDWRDKNQAKLDSFMAWFNNNRLKISELNKVNSSQY